MRASLMMSWKTRRLRLVGEIERDVGSSSDIELLVEIEAEAFELKRHAARGLGIDGDDNRESQDDSDLHWSVRIF